MESFANIRQEIWDDYYQKIQNISFHKDNPQEIIIKPELLDLSIIKEGEGSNFYRPTTLNDYIGQENTKLRILDYINGCKKENESFPHVFLSSPPGHGKTLLATIIANMLNKKFVQCVGGDIKSEQNFVDKINECEGGIIFIDEANMIRKRIGFFMLPIIEQFEIQGKKIHPFSCFFATTHKGDLSKDLDALIQRCELEIELEHYNEEQIITILKQFKEKQYKQYFISNEIYIQIAKNCKQTPRLARRLLRNYIFNNDWQKVLQHNQIVKDGLTLIDVKVLQYLNSNLNGFGRNTIANYLRVKPQTYQYEIEPHLIFRELIIVENKTKITNKGKEFLNDLIKSA